jgi:two-component system NtrC family sensor kinase
MSSPAAELHQMASIGRLLAGIVHEINTPIGSIFSNTDVILRSLEMLGPLLENPTPEALEKARRITSTCQSLVLVDRIACERIRSVIRGLKSFSRVDGNDPRRADLNEHLRDTLKLTQAEFRRRITVETDFGDLPEIPCYPQMLNQVFLNILVNAAQAIEGEGVIKVRTRFESGEIHISIADTGSGMTPEQIRKIFQAGYTTKAVGEGTGLGLAIAREIIEETHGGSIECESWPGAGTIFHIRIPVQSKCHYSAADQTRSSEP